jgi:hypothetical protein
MFSQTEFCYDLLLHQALLQKQFLVTADNLSLMSTIKSDTIYVIQKITHFRCWLLLTDTKDTSL